MIPGCKSDTHQPASASLSSDVQSNREQHPWVAKIVDELRKPDLKTGFPPFQPRVVKIAVLSDSALKALTDPSNTA